MSGPKKPSLEQVFLLVLVREQTATIPELVDRFDKTYEITSRVMRGLRGQGLAKITAIRPHTDRHPACHVYSPTGGGRGALTIPYETALPPKAHAPVVAAPPPPPPPVVVVPTADNDESVPEATPDDELVDPPIAQQPRKRTHSGSGVIAGMITIGRGSRWGSH